MDGIKRLLRDLAIREQIMEQALKEIRLRIIMAMGERKC